MTAFPSHGAGDAIARRFSLCVRKTGFASGSRGFTLVEILLMLAVVGVLASIAMPGLSGMARSVRIEGSAQALVGDLNRARTEAIKNNTSVQVTIEGAYSYRIEGVGLRYLDDEVFIAVSSPDTVEFTAFGSTVSGREVYTLQLGDVERSVVLDAAGQASVE